MVFVRIIYRFVHFTINSIIQQFVQKKLSGDPIESLLHINECTVYSFVFRDTISNNSCKGIYMILTRPIFPEAILFFWENSHQIAIVRYSVI